MVSPSGQLTTGPLPVQVQLDEPGEWLLELVGTSPDAPQLLSVPVYVASKTPMAPLFPVTDDRPMPGPDAIPDEVMDALADVRAAFFVDERGKRRTMADALPRPITLERCARALRSEARALEQNRPHCTRFIASRIGTR